MKRFLFTAIVLSCLPIALAAEVTVSAGGGIIVEPGSSNPVSPTLESELVGTHSWIQSDRLGIFADWSAAGSYAPSAGASDGLLSATMDGSYLDQKFLSRLSISSVASFSSTEPFYGALTSELLLSYGDSAFSVFAAPRYAFVEETVASQEVGARFGTAVLLFETLLVKPVLAAGVSLPTGVTPGWYLGPVVSADWYPGGSLNLRFEAGYRKSVTNLLSPLVAGGPPLPLDTWDRFSAVGSISWLLGGESVLLTVELPCDYTRKTYNAFEGSVDLGVPTWLVGLRPALDLRIPVSKQTDLRLSTKGGFSFSNNTVERIVALSAAAHFELHLD